MKPRFAAGLVGFCQRHEGGVVVGGQGDLVVYF